jgi:hypothetical protein
LFLPAHIALLVSKAMFGSVVVKKKATGWLL